MPNLSDNDTTVTKLKGAQNGCRGTPQSKVLSPLLWLLKLYPILRHFEKAETKLVAYADVLAITI